MDNAAVKTLIELAQDAGEVTRQTVEGTNLIVIPEGYTVRDISKSLPAPLRQYGTFKTADANAFARYCADNGEDETPIYIDADKWTATAVFNAGDAIAPGHCDDIAILQLIQTPEFATLSSVDRMNFSQTDFIEWLEDNAHCIETFADAAGNPLTTAQVIAGVRNISVASKKMSTHADEDMSRERGVLEKIAVMNADSFPSRITYRCQPALDLAPRDFLIRVRVTTNHDKPMIATRVVALPKASAEIANEFRGLVASTVGGVCYIGTYRPGA